MPRTRGRAGAPGRAQRGHRHAGPLPRHRARRRSRLAAARPPLPPRHPRLASPGIRAIPTARSARLRAGRVRPGRAPRATRARCCAPRCEVERALVVVRDAGLGRGARASGARAARRSSRPSSLELGAEPAALLPGGRRAGHRERSRGGRGLVRRRSSARERGDVIPIRPDLYATDAVYRARAAELLQVDPGAVAAAARSPTAASRRPICLSPGRPTPRPCPTCSWHASPPRAGQPRRRHRPADALAFTALLEASKGDASAWVAEVRAVYDGAVALQRAPLRRPARARRSADAPPRRLSPLTIASAHREKSPGRQPRRDRPADHPRLSRGGPRGGRRLFRRRPHRARTSAPPTAPCTSGRRRRRELSPHRPPARGRGARAAPTRSIPGYGFLAERAAFAEAVERGGPGLRSARRRGHPRHGRQDRGAPPDAGRRRAGRAGRRSRRSPTSTPRAAGRRGDRAIR